MKRKLFALFFALAASIGLSWGTEVTSPTTITWDESVISSIELYEVNDSFTNSGITIQMTERQFGGGFYLSKFSTGGQATFVFSSTVGDITGITINAGSVQLNFTGWGGDQTTATWSGTPSSSVTASATPFIDIDQISSIVFTIGPAPEPAPQRYTAPVKAEDLIVGDTLAQGALLSTQRYEGFWFATGRARYHGQVVTRDYLCSFERLGAVSKHGAIDSEAMGYRGCFEPINENGQLGEEWVVTSVSPFTIAGIGTAVITNTNYTSAVDYAVIEPGDTLSEGALIQNGPTIYWMLQDRVYYNDIPRDESDTYLERYHTIGQNGVFEDGGGIIKPRNEQGEEGSKWLVVYYSPLTLAGIGAPSMTLTLAENVSIVGLPIDGITDKGNGVYEVVKGTVFSVQVAEPEHYHFDHWADLGSADPQYSANPRTITMTGNMNLTPVYNIDTYSLTLGVNDSTRGSVKIAPVMKKIIWDEAYLRTVTALASNYMSGPSTYDYVNNIKDGIMMDPQAYYSEVHFRYVPELGYSALYLRATSNVYDAGLNFSKRKEAVFDKFQLVEIYTPEANHNIISENYAPWSYNTSKGCYQIEQFGTWGHVEIVEAFGGELNMRIDSVIFYAPSDLPQGVTPTETPGVYTVEWGSEISFVATPASEDYYLAKWNDQPATNDTLTLTITGEQTVSAYFAHVPYIITLPESVSILGLPIEGITDNGDGTYTIVEGTEFQVQANASEHQQFDHWGDLGSDDPQYAANPRTITMTGSLNLNPVYSLEKFTLTLATNDSTKGVVKVLGAGSGDAEAVPFDAPASWNGDYTYITAADLPGFTPISDEEALALSQTIWVEESGELIFGFDGEYTYSVLMDGGYREILRQLYSRGYIYSSINNSSPVFYTTGAATGIVDNGDGTYTVDWGTELTFVAQPAEDHHLVSWNGEPATSDTLRLTMVGELSVSASFKHNPYIYTLPESVSMVEPLPAGVTDKGNGVYEIEPGTEFQVSVNIPEHYHIAGWADLDAEDAAYLANPRTLTADSTMTLEPIFAIDTYTLTLATNDSTMGIVTLEGAGQGGEQGEEAAQITPDMAPQSWQGDETLITVNDLPGFASMTEADALAWGLTSAPDGMCKLIYAVADGGKFKFMDFYDGGYSMDGTSYVDRDRIYSTLSDGTSLFYATGSEPSGIVDNGDGTYTVDWGTELTFVAQPAEGFMLESWSNGAEVTGDTLKLTMTEELSLTATFKHIPAVITLPDGVNIVEPVPAGITDNGDGTYTVEHGTEFQVSVDSIPAHYHFDHWADLDTTSTQYAANPRTIVAGENLTIEPIFAIDTYTLTLATNDSTKGVVSVEGSGAGVDIVWDANFWNGIQAYMNGEDIVHVNNSKDGITITFDGGDFENGLKDGKIKLDNSDNKLIFTSTVGEFTKIFLKGYVPGNAPEGWDRVAGLTWEVTPSATVELPGSAALVEFEEAVFTLTSAASGIVDNGDGTYTVDWGTELTFVAQPAEGFMLESWSNGTEVTGDTLKLTMTEELSLTANFKYIPAVITLPDGVNIVEPVPAGITDNGDGTYTVEHGTEFQVSVDSIPAHYHFDHWADLDTTSTQYAANPRTIVADSALTLEPIFAIDTHTLTLATNDSTKGVVILEGAGQGGEPEGKTIEWDSAFMDNVIAYMSGSGALHSNNTKDGITVTYEGASMGDGMQNGLIHLDSNDKLVFTSTVGDIAKIEIYGNLPNIAPENWTIGEALTWEGTPAAVVELPADVHVTQFVKTVFTLVPAASGIVDNGDGTYTVEWGTELTFIAQPAENYHLDSWWNGGFAETGDTLKITLEGDTAVNAYFKHDTYILSVEGTEIETAKFHDGTDSVVVLNPGTLIGVVEGDSVLLTTTANYSSANIGEDLTITVHYDIKVVSTQDDYEYALAITDSIYPIKGFIIEPLTPDAEAEAEEEEAENKEGLEIQAYGYCNGSSYSIKYHLKSGNPDQYKIDFADARFTDVDWTDLTTNGADGTIDVEIPVDLPTGDYSMTVTFRDSRFTWLESEPITVSLHVNLPETYIAVLFDNVVAVVDTCECLTDIQWYWRADDTQAWQLIEGATGYYYKQEGGLSGEYFIKAKMNGIDTYTCPQTDVETLYGEGDAAQVILRVSPNPVVTTTNLTIEGSDKFDHNMRIVNINGWEVYNDTFEGAETTVDMSTYPQGNYMISVDGVVINVIKK